MHFYTFFLLSYNLPGSSGLEIGCVCVWRGIPRFFSQELCTLKQVT